MDTTTPPRKRLKLRITPLKRHWVLVVIVILATVLRAWGMGMRLPLIYHPDEPKYINIVQNMLRNGNPDPHFFRYPTLFFYINVLAYLPYIAVSRLTGAMSSTSEILPITTIAMGSTYAPQPGLILLQRSVTVLFSTGVVVLAYAVTLKLTRKRRAACLAALLTALSSTHVTHGQMITPDTFVAFFAMAAVYMALLIHEKGRTRDYILGGIMVGLTASSKYNGLIIAVVIVAAHLLRHGWKGMKDWRIYLAGFCSIAAFFATSPYALVDLPFFWKEIGIVGRHYASGHDGMEGNTLRFYLSVLWQNSSILFPLAIIAMLRAIRQRDSAALIVAAFPVVYFIFIASYIVRNDRTILPMMAMLLILAVWLLEQLSDSLRSISQQGWRIATYAGLLIILALGLVIPTVYTIKSMNTRYTVNGRDIAYTWLVENLPEGSTVAIEAYVPYMDPKTYDLHKMRAIIDHEAAWYQENEFDYLVYSESMFGRYYLEPDRYPQQIHQYDALFEAFELVRTFDEGDYTVHIYKVHSE